jgi:sugar porter (SP) family MFS transporter
MRIQGDVDNDDGKCEETPLAPSKVDALRNYSSLKSSPSIAATSTADRPVPFVYLLAACAALNSCNVGLDIGVNSPAGILVQEDLELSNLQLELFMGSMNFFALIGALGSSTIIAKMGMTGSFIVSSVVFVIGILVMVLSNSYKVIMVGRALVGMGTGFGFAITPIYITEISPKEHRGFFTSWSEIGVNVGILLGFTSGLVFNDDNFSLQVSWRLMFSTGFVFPILVMVMASIVMVESPRWLVRQGRDLDALGVLQRLYPQGYDVEVVLNDIQQDIEREKLLGSTSVEGLSTLLCWKLSPTIRRMLVIGLGIAVSHEISGIDAIQYYLVYILEASGITGRAQQARYLIALGTLKLVCLFVASYFVDRWGRRPLMLLSVSGMTISLITMAAIFFHANGGNQTVVVASLALYLAFFSIGLGPLGWIMPPEIFSTTLRSRAVGLTTFANRLTATVMTSTMLSIADTITWGGYFGLLATICGIILIMSFFHLPETKGRRLEDMTNYFAEESETSKLIEALTDRR